MSFREVQTEDRRLTLLKCLEAATAYKAAQFVLGRYCEQFAHIVSQDQIKTDLAWLREQGLVTIEQPEGVYVATLTARGLDVATGRAQQPGVARPQPQ